MLPCCVFRVVMSVAIFGSSLTPVVCVTAHVLLTLFVHSGVQHIYCIVFCFISIRLVSSVLPVSVDFQF